MLMGKVQTEKDASPQAVFRALLLTNTRRSTAGRIWSELLCFLPGWGDSTLRWWKCVRQGSSKGRAVLTFFLAGWPTHRRGRLTMRSDRTGHVPKVSYARCGKERREEVGETGAERGAQAGGWRRRVVRPERSWGGPEGKGPGVYLVIGTQRTGRQAAVPNLPDTVLSPQVLVHWILGLQFTNPVIFFLWFDEDFVI